MIIIFAKTQKSEVNELDTGLIIELWNRGMSWDKLLGVYWLSLASVKHSDTLDVKEEEKTVI